MNNIVKKLSVLALSGMVLFSCNNAEESYDFGVPGDSFHVASAYTVTELDPVNISIDLEGAPSKVEMVYGGTTKELAIADGKASYSGTYGDFGLEKVKDAIAVDFKCYAADGSSFVVKHSMVAIGQAAEVAVDEITFNDKKYEIFFTSNLVNEDFTAADYVLKGAINSDDLELIPEEEIEESYDKEGNFLGWSVSFVGSQVAQIGDTVHVNITASNDFGTSEAEASSIISKWTFSEAGSQEMVASTPYYDLLSKSLVTATDVYDVAYTQSGIEAGENTLFVSLSSDFDMANRYLVEDLDFENAGVSSINFDKPGDLLAYRSLRMVTEKEEETGEPVEVAYYHYGIIKIDAYKVVDGADHTFDMSFFAHSDGVVVSE
ncbi:hypothetical protein [Persicobacter diffluens]|uniref:Uncharacterized protein n=1 Tax=Persicobacter diffluens TaxID=981 RepID=A0AAN5AKN6_9BACT|nr:hypothetical protein PEDI_35920 [Persicobacter diffluens]